MWHIKEKADKLRKEKFLKFYEVLQGAGRWTLNKGDTKTAQTAEVGFHGYKFIDKNKSKLTA